MVADDDVLVGDCRTAFDSPDADPADVIVIINGRNIISIVKIMPCLIYLDFI